MKFKARYLIVLSVFFLVSCAGPRSCFPNFSELKTKYPHVIYLGPKKPPEIKIEKGPPAGYTPLSQISLRAQWAVLVSEDWAFYQHKGYDDKQIKDAIGQSIEAGKLKRGASTITQQVVRNIYLTKRKTITRKVRELWMATKIEKTLGKKKILELYFNIAEWGEGIYGINRAARTYFNKSPAELTAKEGAFLAMLLPSPKKYAISFRQKALTPYARKTIRSILGKMVQAKILTPEERAAEWATPYAWETKPEVTPVDEDSSDEKNIEDESGDDEAADEVPAGDSATDTAADSENE